MGQNLREDWTLKKKSKLQDMTTETIKTEIQG